MSLAIRTRRDRKKRLRYVDHGSPSLMLQMLTIFILRSHGENIIVVWVGRDTAATKFYVDADLAIQHSEFFSAALKDGSKEAEERTVRLPDLDEGMAAAFEDFHSFLSSGKVTSGETDESAKYDAEKGSEEWDRLVDSWILGNVLVSGSFKDAVVDAMVHKTLTNSVPIDIHMDLYQNSSDSAPIRKLVVDIAVHIWYEEDIATLDPDDEPKLQAKFLRDVAVAFHKVKQLSKAEQAKDPIESSEGGCHYHEHGADKPCYKTMFG